MVSPIPEPALAYTHPDYIDPGANVNLRDPAMVRLDLTTVADERGLVDAAALLKPLLARLAADPEPLLPYPMADRFLQKRLGRLVLDAFGGEAVPADRVFFGAGSYPLWKEVAAFLLRKGTLVGAAPLYPELVGWFEALGGRYRAAVAPDFRFPLAAVLDALEGESDPVAVLVDRPGNATGVCPTDEEGLALVAAAARRDVLVVVDEVYGSFLEPRRSWLPWTLRFGNLVVIRSLSKAYDLRGLRFGFAVFSEPLARVVRQVHSPFEPGSFAVAAAEHLLATAPDLAAPLRRAVVAAKTELVARIRARGVEVLPTAPEVPNLMMTRPGFDLYGFFARKGVKVASGSRFRTTTPGMDDRFCRIRTPLRLERIEALDRVLGEL